MSEWVLALLLKPLVYAVVFGLPLYAIRRYMCIKERLPKNTASAPAAHGATEA